MYIDKEEEASWLLMSYPERHAKISLIRKLDIGIVLESENYKLGV